jgi:Rieske Fe-S protein
MTSTSPRPGPSRRHLIRAGGAGLAVTGALAACGSDDDDTPDVVPGGAQDDDGSGEASGGQGAGGSGIDVPVAEVPEGGSVFRQAEHVIVTQPSAGDFRAFDATCPHEGCAVSRTDGAELVCPCHGSRFTMDSGDVVGGPAERGLTALTVQVEGDTLTVQR